MSTYDNTVGIACGKSKFLRSDTLYFQKMYSKVDKCFFLFNTHNFYTKKRITQKCGRTKEVCYFSE